MTRVGDHAGHIHCTYMRITGGEGEERHVPRSFYASVISRNRRTVLRTVAAAVVETVHAPPAITFLHEWQFQMPTAVRFTESLPQKVQV